MFTRFLKTIPPEGMLIFGAATAACGFGIYTGYFKMSTPDGIYSPEARHEVRKRLEGEFDPKHGSMK